MSIKIIATSDLHLGRKSSDIPEGVEEASVKYTWNIIVEKAVEKNVDLLLLSGDIVDKDNCYYEAIGALQSGFERLKQKGIEVYFISGNHDQGVISQVANSYNYDNLHLLGYNGTWEFLNYSKEEINIQFLGWSFPSQQEEENPLRTLEKLNPEIDYINIGLLHGDVDDPESKYAPIDINSLISSNVDVWILGHIHKYRELKENNPYIVYPGSPHAMDAGEQGPHGIVFMELEGKDDIKTEFIPTSPIRYETLKVQIEKTENKSEIDNKITAKLGQEGEKFLTELKNVSYLVFDLLLEGENTNPQQIEEWMLQIPEAYEKKLESGTKVTVRKVRNYIKPAIDNLKKLSQNPSPAGKLAETILAIQNGNTTTFLESLVKDWEIKLEEINGSSTYLDLDNKRATREDAEQYILKECNRLLGVLIEQQNNEKG